MCRKVYAEGRKDTTQNPRACFPCCQGQINSRNNPACSTVPQDTMLCSRFHVCQHTSTRREPHYSFTSRWPTIKTLPTRVRTSIADRPVCVGKNLSLSCRFSSDDDVETIESQRGFNNPVYLLKFAPVPRCLPSSGRLLGHSSLTEPRKSFRNLGFVSPHPPFSFFSWSACWIHPSRRNT
jgi:hypothetical protein